MNSSGEIYDISDLIKADKGRKYEKDFNRIKNGKKFDINFNGYSEEYIKEMIMYYEDSGDYSKSGYLNLKLNGFKEHK